MAKKWKTIIPADLKKEVHLTARRPMEEAGEWLKKDNERRAKEVCMLCKQYENGLINVSYFLSKIGELAT